MDLMTPEVCRDIAEKYFKEKDIKVVDVKMSNLKEIAGYVSLPKRLFIKVKKAGDEDLKTASFFIKEISETNAYQGDVAREMKAFFKECHLYSDILSLLKPYIIGKSISPEFYFHKENRILVLQDLCAEGYKNNYNEYDLDHCEIVIKALARYHASTIIFETKEKKKINEMFPDVVKENFFQKGNSTPGVLFWRASIATIKSVLDACYDHVSEEKKKRALDLMWGIPDGVLPSKKFRNVLSHSDVWANNIMFKYGEDGKVEEVRFVDFQLSRYSLPAIDILAFLHIMMLREFRAQHESHLLKLYHDTLGSALAYHGLQVDLLFPWSEFLGSLEEARPTGLSIAALYVHFVYLPEDVVRDKLSDQEQFANHWSSDRKEIVLQVIKDNPTFKKRLFDSIDDLISTANPS